MKKRIIALLLASVLLVSVFAGCAKKPNNSKPLVVGYSNFNSKFSPFFGETAYDQDVATMTSVLLLETDRQGAVIEKGKTGETRAYNGTDYKYNGIADLTITTNKDGTVDYDFDLRDDVKFSDGKPLSVDDVIFSMYVLSDPTYDGSSTFFAIPIKGMEDYRAGMAPLYQLLTEAGEKNTDFSNWDKATQDAFWKELDATGPKFAQTIIDYCINNGYNDAKDPIEAIAKNWGYELKKGATVEDFWAAIKEAYKGDIVEAAETEKADATIYSLMENYDKYSAGVSTGKSVEKIEGIQKTGDHSLRVTLTEVDATAIYQLGIAVCPLHYYGDAAKYNYEKNQFGFTKGDLSTVRAKTTQPMGAGPYKFQKFENGVVYFEANENYFLGEPKTTRLQFMESNDKDKLNGVATGTIDITDPTYSQDTVKAIKAQNSNGDVSGDKITTDTVDNLGYGYLGISAKGVKVGDDGGSDASKNLRKAFATIFSVYRDVTVNSYYGDAASVINYPISNTSWAAPQKTDADYAIAFSKDVNGKEIYTSDMKDEQKYDAALQAALGYFEAAGYTVKDGKVTAAPEGAKMEYEVWIPADGSGDHPSFMMLNLASDALKKIGIKLTVKDLANSDDLWTGIEADQVPMWCAAWGATPDPDMYQVYYSGVGTKNEPGGSNYMYDIADKDLDKLILDARKSMDQSYRKQMYKSCLDIIVDWAVEVPVYQRQNAIIFSTERVKMDTVTPDITTYYNWYKEIHNIELN